PFSQAQNPEAVRACSRTESLSKKAPFRQHPRQNEPFETSLEPWRGPISLEAEPGNRTGDRQPSLRQSSRLREATILAGRVRTPSRWSSRSGSSPRTGALLTTQD